jgi:diamine N-acetyltransferase
MADVLTIRPALPSDVDALAPFAARVFIETYRDLDDPREIGDYIERHFSADAMGAVIADPLGATLLASIDQQLIGYTVLDQRPAPDCVTGPAPVQLSRIYLDARRHGRGHGDALLDAALDSAQALGGQTLWLGVDHRNRRAIRFYQRRGFKEAGARDFAFGGRIYRDPCFAAPLAALIRR